MSEPASGLPYWLDSTDDAWDTLRLGGFTFPGIVEVDGDVSRDIEQKKAKGQDNPTITDNGYNAAKVKIVLRIYSQTQWTELQSLVPEIHPRRKGGIRNPVELIHPAPNLLGVSSVYVTAIGFPKIDSDKQLVMTIEAIEWIPAPPPVKKAVGTSDGKTYTAEEWAGAALIMGDVLNTLADLTSAVEQAEADYDPVGFGIGNGDF